MINNMDICSMYAYSPPQIKSTLLTKIVKRIHNRSGSHRSKIDAKRQLKLFRNAQVIDVNKTVQGPLIEYLDTATIKGLIRNRRYKNKILECLRAINKCYVVAEPHKCGMIASELVVQPISPPCRELPIFTRFNFQDKEPT